MDRLFLTVLKMSITSSYVILFVLIARLILKKCPKIFSYILWAVVLFRLICPVSFESKLSLIPNNSISEGSISLTKPLINYIKYSSDNLSNNIYEEGNLTEDIETNKINTSNSVNNPINILSIASTVWIIAISIIIFYSSYSFIKLKKYLKNSKLIKDNIYENSDIGTAFVIGVINPKIYIPKGLSKSEEQYILAHERIHIKRYDYIIKIIAYLALIIHCFNPLVWLSFVLMTKDMEMSCDEAVVKEMGSEIKKEYSMSLLSFATDKKGIGMAPIAFGEGEVKSRVKNILNYKKPRFWIVIISAVALIAIAMGLIFNPVNNEEDNKYLDINKVLEEIFITDEVIIRKVGEGGYTLGGETFSENFKAKIKDLKEHKETSAYEISEDIIVYIYGGSEYTLSFYENEPNLMKVSYNGKSRYYKSLNDMYTEVKLMSMLVSNWTPEDILVAVMDGKKTNKTSYDERPRGVDYLELSIGNRKYFIYEDKGKYYVERPYVAIYKISEAVYESAKKFSVEPQQYTEDIIDQAFIEDLVCKTVEEQEDDYNKEDILIVAPKIFGVYEEENKLKVFTTTMISNYSLKENLVEFKSGGIKQYAITYIKSDDGSYYLEEFLPAMDGAFLESSIRDFCVMPISGEKIEGLADEIINHYMDYSDIVQLEREKLIQYINDNELKGISILEKGYNEPDKLLPLTN